MTVETWAAARRHAWWGLLVVNAVLAVPTAVLPGSRPAAVTYLCGEVVLSAVIFAVLPSMSARERRPWLLLAIVTLMWFTGDLIQRVAAMAGASVGRTPDAFWLSSYVVEILAVNGLIRARELPRPLVRDVQLDVLVITTAAALGDWLVVVQPGIGTGQSLPTTVIGLLYPLGDVVIFSLALTIILVPGSRAPATIMLVTCLGVTLPLDFLFQALAWKVPSFDTSHLDAGYLVLNSLLGAAALHPGRHRLVARSRDGADRHLQLWRIGVLGVSLVAVSVTNVFMRARGLRLVPDLVATLVISMTIILRFYRAARSQELAAATLRELADHDQLTGAANRALLRRRLPAFVSGRRGLLFYIDLDGFKALNDVHGHHFGDAVLRAVTVRLAAIVRDTDTVARIGGDEFVLLLPGCEEAEAPGLARRIHDDVCRPLTLDSITVHVGASVGVVVLERAASLRLPAADQDVDDEALADDVLRSGDAAMYAVKRQGGGIHIVRFETPLSTAS